MGGEGEGSGVKGGGKWGERGREVGIGYPLSTPSFIKKCTRNYTAAYTILLAIRFSFEIYMHFGEYPTYVRQNVDFFRCAPDVTVLHFTEQI